MKSSTLILVTSSAIALLATGQAAAQAPATARADSGSSAGQIEDIVVTARRVTENLQTTPISISVATEKTLQQAVIVDAAQLQVITPGLISVPTIGSHGLNFSIRGQIGNNTSIANDQPIGTYFDGVYSARSSGGLFNMVDVERVEVLKGPQGTLFGRNTTGGAVSVISNKPTGDFEGSFRGRYGNYNAWEATGIVNIPLQGEQLAFRGVYQHTQHDGYGRNLAFGTRIGSDNMDFFRGSLLIAPTDQIWRVLIQGDYSNRHATRVTGLKSFTASPFNTFALATCSGPTASPLCPFVGPAGDSLANYAVDSTGRHNLQNVSENSPLPQESTNSGMSATVDIDLSDEVAFKSITAFRRTSNPSYQDIDGTPYVLAGSLPPPRPASKLTQSQFSEEAQLTGSGLDSRLKWIVGAFYFEEQGRDFGYTAQLYPLNPVVSVIDVDGDNRSYAGYGQFTYNITDAIRFTGGLRYTRDERELVRKNKNELPTGVRLCALAVTALDPGQGCQATNNASFDYLSYTAGIDWQAAEGVFLYAKTSRADRSGGFNALSTVGSATAVNFGPERVTDYEVGTKLDLFDRHVRINAAAFYSDYQDAQRSIPVLIPGGALSSGIQNAATARITGAEFEVTVLPFEGLRLNASATYLDAKYKSFPVPGPGGVTLDASNTAFPYVPKFTYVLNADYTVPLDAATLNFHVDWSHRSSNFNLSALNTPATGAIPASFAARNPNVSRVPAYGLLGAQIGVGLRDDQIEISVYGRNILNKQYYGLLFTVEDTPLGVTAYVPGDPRTYGVSVRFKF